MFKRALLGFFLLYSLVSHAEEINTLPFDYMNLQYAGNIGFIGVGGGNTFLNDHYDFELYLGFTPHIKYISEVAIISLAMKNNYVPYTFKAGTFSIRPYMGLGMIIGANHRYDPNWQDNINKAYYYQNNWHVTANLGLIVNTKYRDDSNETLGLYVETSSLDVYMNNYIKNSDTLALSDIFSIAFGIRMGF